MHTLFVPRVDLQATYLIPSVQSVQGLFNGLGLTAMTDARIEHVMCTSALAAFN